MEKIKRLGILTGGGDVPGLNTVIKTIASRCFADGVELLGIRRGWQGIVEVDPNDPASLEFHTLPLDESRVRTVDRSGGTILHSSRVNPASISRENLPERVRDREFEAATDGDKLDVGELVMENLNALGVDGLVVTGGDDTLGYAAKLHARGFAVAGVPKTMDNDVPGTEYCLGFSTAVTRSINFVQDLRVSSGSHERIAIVELFGRNSGATSLFVGHLAAADRVLISEVDFNVETLCQQLAADQDTSPSHYSLCVVSEGAKPAGGKILERGRRDAYGHRKLGGVGQWLCNELEERTGRQTMGQRLAYLMRSGTPDSLDRMVALNFGNLAYELVAEGRGGMMAALVDGKYAAVPLSHLKSGARPLDHERLYDSIEHRPRVHRPEGLPLFLA